MVRLRTAIVLVAVASVLLAPASRAEEDPAKAAGVLRVKQHHQRALPVPAWNPQSPQRLARIEGRLYQRDRGLYFPVIPGRVVVGLAKGVESWNDLVSRAIESDPQTFGNLVELKQVRVNHLGTVKLAAPPESDLATWCERVFSTGLVRYAEVATVGFFHATPNDPKFIDQWSLRNIGQSSGTPGADVDAELAWDVTAGDPSIVVAVVDSGTDIDHEDLAANVWHNDDEIPDNGIDDDSNGYIDDWEGWDFHNHNNEPRPIYYHGTHVTGIVNAVGNNGIGIAGLAGGFGSAGVLGMALGVGDDAEDGDVIDDAIIYAADNGAHIITMALGTGETQAINDALVYAYETKDVFIDCSAGNNGSYVGYPATHPAAMAVAATSNKDRKSSYSSPGPEVEVAAPGDNILSTQMNDTYGISSGTSFASPHVAALAGLIRGFNPALTAPDVRQLIIESAEDVESPGYDFFTGHGRINAYNGVTLASTSDGIVRFIADAVHCGGMIDLIVVDIDLATAGTVSVTASSDTEPGGEPVLLTESASGSGFFRGSIASSYDAAVSDGVLQIADGDNLLVEYVDLDDGLGGTGVTKTNTATADCVAPAVAELRVEEITGDSAAVLWSTDEAANSRVAYGPAIPPAGSASDSWFNTDHRIDLIDLVECTVYYYSAGGNDPAGNLSVADNGGSYFHFETLVDFGQGLQPCHQGRIAIDVDAVGCASSLPVTVGDRDLNTDPGTAESVTVTVTSTTEPVPESLTLTETGPDTSIFSASIPTASGAAVPGDGVLQVTDGDLLTATYEDTDDGTGSPRISFDIAVADCVAPIHLLVTVSEITAGTAQVEWLASEPVTGYVEWGTTAALGNQVASTTLTTAHAVTIGSFAECGQVYFRIVSTDAQGYSTIADADGAPYEFNGATMQGIVFADGFETDTGWTLEGEWERGVPQGLGTSPGDPISAVEGVNVLGHDLSGLGNRPGDYEINTQESAISPAIDLSALSSVELWLSRWVNVGPGGTAYLEVTDGGGTWNDVWNSGDSGGRTESAWTDHIYDVSAWAAGNPAFQVRFRQGGRILGFHAGWNVDDLVVRDSSQPAFGGCGGCAGAPTFAGATTSEDNDPCADSGVTVYWTAAPAWGTGNGGTYAVYRDTAPGFSPSPANRVASGVAGTSWTDASAPAGQTLHYLVRAENDESCSTGPNNGGVMDANLVYIVALNETAQPSPGEVGDSLRLAPVNQAHARLAWTATAGAATYHVYRSPTPDGTFSPIGQSADPVFEDPGAMVDGQSWYYRIEAADKCGNEL